MTKPDDRDYIGWHFNWIEEWSQFLPGYNWRTFHPVMIEVEDDRIMGGVEMTLVVVGVGFRVRWNYKRTEAVEDILEQVRQIEEGEA